MIALLIAIVKFILLYSVDLEFDGNVNARRQIEFHKRIDRLGGGVENVDETLVRSQFELLAAVLILVSGAKNGHDFLFGGKRNGTGHLGAGFLHGLDYLLCGDVDEIVVERLEFDAYLLPSH